MRICDPVVSHVSPCCPAFLYEVTQQSVGVAREVVELPE